MNPKVTPVGVILAGGASRRMGSDKAFVEVDGRPMIVRVADVLWEAGCHPVVCQGGTKEITKQLGLEVVADPQPGSGPLSAIHAALAHHRSPILVAACDLVDLETVAVDAVIAAATGGTGPHVSVATADGRPHLLSYWADDVVDALTDLLAEGVTAYRVALERLGAVEVPVDPVAVRNVNRPEDLG